MIAARTVALVLTALIAGPGATIMLGAGAFCLRWAMWDCPCGRCKKNGITVAAT